MAKRRKRLSVHTRFVATFLAASALTSPVDAQQNLTWDTNGAAAGTGGNGNWDTSSSRWFNGATFQAWQNPSFDNAFFRGTAGNVTLDAPINVHNVIFTSTGYAINSGTLTLGGDKPTIMVNAGTTTINSALGGSNGLIKSGAGTLVLTADSTGFTGVSTVAAGILRIDNANALGTSTSASDLVLNKGSTFYFTTDFTHDYTLLGTTVNLQGVEGAVWNGSPTLTAPTILNLSGTGGALAGDFADTGANVLSLARNGMGRMILSGSNAYTGATTITRGILQLGSAGALSTESNLVFNGAMGTGGSIELTAASGDFTRSLGTGPGEVRWTGDGGFQSSGSARIVDIGGTGGTLTWGNGGFVPQGNRLILGTSNNGTLDFQNGIDFGGGMRSIQVEGGAPGAHTRMNGVLSGVGGLNVIGNGTGVLELTAANTYMGGTILNPGTLIISSDANLGAASGSLTLNGGVLQNTAAFTTGRSITLSPAGGTFQTDADLAASGTISGSGGLNKTGSGALVLTGDNTYIGGTTVTAGTLQVGNGGTKGSIAGDVNNNGRLIFNRSNNTSHSGIFSGTGALDKAGAGVLTLLGDSTAFGGHTSVHQGTLAINGALGGTLHVLANAHLQGTGHVGATTVAGTVAPGNSIGTLTVHGNYVQLHGSTYEVEIDEGGASDQVIVTDLADIQGGTVSVIPAGEEFTPGSRFTILTANSGLTGKFDSLTHGLVNLSLSYDPTHVYLDVLRFCDMVETPNQCATGSATENLGSGNPIYNAVIHLPDQGSVREAFNHLSGEGHASVQGVMIEDSRFIREAVSDRVREAFHSAGALTHDTPGHILQENPATGRALWGRVLGSFGHRDGGLNADRIGRALAGIFVGGDMLIADKFLVGLAGGYTAGSYDGARLFTGSSDNYHVSLYGGTQLGPLGLRVGSAYIWHDLETGRDVMFAGFIDHLKAEYAARTGQVFGEVGYALPTQIVSLEPFARIAYVNMSTKPFQEHGGASRLHSDKNKQDTAYTTLGVNLAKTFSRSGRMTTTLRGMIGWRHAFGELTPVSTFTFPAGSTFSTTGVPIARNGIVLAGGLDAHVLKAATLGIYYQGQILHNIADHGVRANLTWRF